jgi:FMN-dependent NADH-azoreductase
MSSEKILFINACMRPASRTHILADRYFAEICPTGTKREEIRVDDLNIRPLSGADAAQRDEEIRSGHFENYPLAKQFASADEIVIAAPLWDMTFPSKLKVYLEHICVNGITFGYGRDGKPVKKCRAQRLIYITTAGGFLRENSAVKAQMEELCGLFCIPDFRFFCGQGLDVFPEKTSEILDETFQIMHGEL